MNFDYYTLGGGVYLVQVLNFIAALGGSGNFEGLLTAFVALTVMIVAFQMALNRQGFNAVSETMILTMILGILWVPKCTVRVIDTINPNIPGAVINNVPLAVGVIANITSIGSELTSIFEFGLSAPDDLKYSKNGLLFGNGLISRMHQARIVDDTFNENMSSWIRGCILPKVSLGTISSEEIKNSTNLWQLLTANASQNSLISYKETNTYITKSCVDVANLLTSQLNAQIDKSLLNVNRSLFQGQADNIIRAKVVAMTPIVYEYLGNLTTNAQDTILQSMMINIYNDSIGDSIVDSGNTSAMLAYNQAKTEAQINLSFKATGLQAESYIPLIRVVFEILFLAMFPLVMLLLLSPMRGQIIKSYFMGFIWLQLWPPMYAILNFIINTNSAEKIQSAMINPNGAVGITLFNMSNFEYINTQVANLASNLQMAIPVLSLMVMYGAGQAMSSVNALTGSISSHSNQSAQEVSSGNISLGNLNAANRSLNNFSGGNIQSDNYSSRQQNLAPNKTLGYGSEIFKDNDGSTIFTAQNGEVVVSNTSPQTRVKVTDSMVSSAGISNQLSQAKSTQESASTDYSKALANSISAGKDYYKGMASNNTTTDSTGKNESVRYSESANKSIGMLEKIAKDTGMGLSSVLSIANSATASAKAGVGVDLGNLVPFVKASGGIDYSTNSDTKKSNEDRLSEGISKILDLSKNQEFREGWDKANDEYKSHSLQHSTSQDQGVRESFNKSQSEVRTSAEHLNYANSKVDSLTNSLNQSHTQSGGVNIDRTHEFSEFLRNKGVKQDDLVRLLKGDSKDKEELNNHLADFYEHAQMPNFSNLKAPELNIRQGNDHPNIPAGQNIAPPPHNPDKSLTQPLHNNAISNKPTPLQDSVNNNVHNNSQNLNDNFNSMQSQFGDNFDKTQQKINDSSAFNPLHLADANNIKKQK